MEKLFKSIDHLFLPLFQFISDKLQLVTGLTCFTVGHLFLALSMSYAFVQGFLLFQIGDYSYTPNLIFNSVGLSYFAYSTNKYEQLSTSKFRNTLEVLPVFLFLRVLGLFFLIWKLHDFLYVDSDVVRTNYYSNLFSVIAVYFYSCTPLPPGKNKFQQLVKSMFSKPTGLSLTET
jgi:hypothetical protein